jgi:hypothetical protein
MTEAVKIPLELLEFATPRQAQIIGAINANGGINGAARKLGIAKQTIQSSMESVRRRAGKGMAAEPAASVVAPAPIKILVLPDVQAKPWIDFTYLRRIGQYILEKRPDKVVCIGDFADMPSLSSYDKGKKSFEGRRYKLDIEASLDAMRALLGPLEEFNEAARSSGAPEYLPEKIMTLGNHENRIARAINDDPMLDGVLSVKDLEYEDFGWRVIPFLEVEVIDGIAFSHFFVSGVMGRPVSTAQACLTKKHMSCVQGHQQGLQIATGYRGDGQLLTSIIAGSCYEHDEDYMSAQGNKHWRGLLMLHDVRDGVFDLMPVSLSYINKKYPDTKLPDKGFASIEEVLADKERRA